MKRRDALMNMGQKAGEKFTDFYRAMEKQAQECQLAAMMPADWIGHLALINMNNKQLSKEVLTKVMASGQKFDKKAMQEIVLAHKSFQNLKGTSYHQVKRTGAGPPSGRSSRDSSRNSDVICYKCSRKGHFARECREGTKKWCTSCMTSTHDTDKCRNKQRQPEVEIGGEINTEVNRTMGKRDK